MTSNKHAPLYQPLTQTIETEFPQFIALEHYCYYNYHNKNYKFSDSTLHLLKCAVILLILIDIAFLNNALKEVSHSNIFLVMNILLMIYLKVLLFDKYLLNKVNFNYNQTSQTIGVDEYFDDNDVSDLVSDVLLNSKETFISFFLYHYYYSLLQLCLLLSSRFKLESRKFFLLHLDSTYFVLFQCRFLKILS